MQMLSPFVHMCLHLHPMYVTALCFRSAVEALEHCIDQLTLANNPSHPGSGDLWEPALDPSEWPEMRHYVSPEELNAYADLCKSAADADAARGAHLPPAPPRITLTLNDLVTAEEARMGLGQGSTVEGAY